MAVESSAATTVGADEVWQVEAEPDLALVSEEPEPEPAPTRRRRSPQASEPPPPLPRLLEAALFASPAPLTAARLTELFRGVDEAAVVEAIADLNRGYRDQGRPYSIEGGDAGYRFALRPAHVGVLETLYGGLKETRLTPAAVEALSVVAYRQPATKAAVDSVRGQDSGALLRQLQRRGLVELAGEGRDAGFITTPRFLSLFQLQRLDELPRAEELPRL